MIRSISLPVYAGFLWACAFTAPALAQYATVPEPSFRPVAPPSAASDPKDYKLDVARHLYATYSRHIYRGVMPPMLNAVMITETRIDPTGQVLGVEIKREPAQDKDAMPWAIAMIKAAAP